MTDFIPIPSPCYVIDEQKFRSNLSLIKKVQDESGVEILMALKAFANWGVFDIVKEYNFSAAASGIYEARLCYEELEKKAHTFCPAIKKDDFDEMINYSSHINFNSLSQYNIYAQLLEKNQISAGIRVNPGYSPVENPLYNPAGKGSRLGVPFENLPSVLPQNIRGLHFHALCENNSYEFEKVLQEFIKNYEKYFHQLDWVNFGGGHLITKKGYDVSHLIKVLKNFQSKYNLKVFLEPGSAFTWQTGDLISTVADVVNNDGIKTAIMDISFTAHMPDCLEMPYMPDIKGAVINGEGGHIYRIGGNSCLAGDYMGNWSFIDEIEPGQQLVFKDMIHYTTVKTTMFNGVQHPAIAIKSRTGKVKIIKEFSYSDYKNRLS